MPEVDTIAVLGDSSSIGFGTKGRSYGVVLAELLGARTIEVSADFGRTTRAVLAEHAAVLGDLRPDLVVLQTGMADSLVHPGRRAQRLLEHFAPKTWHGVDGLERRAIFSNSRRVRARQWAASTAKTTLKRSLVTLTGGYTRMQPDGYGECLNQLLTELEARAGIVAVIVPYEIDEHFFPRQRRSTGRFADVCTAVLAGHPSVVTVRVDPRLDRWDDFLDDHAHWSTSGHAAVAAEIARAVRAAKPGVAAVPAGPTSA